MTNRQIMLKALNKKVLPPLLEQGFTGKHPHYRREKDDCIELISFDTNKWGGSFNIEVSAIFPNSEFTNCLSDTIAEDVWDTSNRYRLDGMPDGWFYYNDDNFNLEIAEKICDEINKQFKKAFIWLEEFEKSDNKEFFQFDDFGNNNNKKFKNLLRKIKTKLQEIFS